MAEDSSQYCTVHKRGDSYFYFLPNSFQWGKETETKPCGILVAWGPSRAFRRPLLKCLGSKKLRLAAFLTFLHHQ